jgi:hypothetical protein
MKRIIDTSETLGTVDAPEGLCELRVSAVANFDEVARRLVVKLESSLRPTGPGLGAKESHAHAAWLPANETITESVALEECREMVEEIFQRWVRKVRAAAPQLHHV